MATVTPNFNWPVPTSTDLVKDGATAIEALGDSIDGSLVDLKGGTTGQVLSKTTNTDMDFTWVTTDDANAIQNSIVDAKGDLIAATANDTPARLAVGANDAVLAAASGEATGLKWLNTWTAFTPSVSNITVGNGDIVGRYLKVGKMVSVFIRFTLGSTSAMGSSNYIGLPFPYANGNIQPVVISIEDSGTTFFPGIGFTIFDQVELCVLNTTGTLATYQGVSSTVPMTWTTGDSIRFNWTYETSA
jgi:hypothetical protein